MNSVMNTLTHTTRMAGLQLKKNAPEIMIIGGVIGGIGTTVLACFATRKAIPIVQDAKKEIADIMAKVDDESVIYTEEDAKTDRKKVYFRTAGKLAKTYAVSAGTGVGSALLILGGTGILNQRNAGLAASLATTTLGFNEYRKGMIDKLGDEGKKLDSELRNGTTEVEVKEEVIDENGKKKTVKKKVKVVDAEKQSKLACDYRRVFDWHNPYWKPDNNYNTIFLRGRQSYFNTRLVANDYLFWNDVLSECGFPKCEPGQIVGWTANGEDEYVDFRMEEAYMVDEEGVRRPVVLLDFNCEGSILNKVNWKESKWELQ